MANLYGVANAPGQPGQNLTIGAIDVTCPAGTETNVITSAALIAPSGGYFYAYASGVLTIALTATPATQVTVAIRVGGGADSMQFGVNALTLTASAILVLPISLFTAASQTAWQGAGSTVSISVNPTAQQVITRVQGSSVCIGLQRASDQ